jgi:hypothetical protein
LVDDHRSRGFEGDVEELGGCFKVLETFGNDAQRECLHAGNSLVAACPYAMAPAGE